MHRRVLATIAFAATLLLAGCGSSTITVTASSAGQVGSGVVTGDSDAIAALKTKLAAFFGAGATVTDGDQHTGNQVCTFNASKNGHSYSVVIYGALPASSCDASGQTNFLSQAP
jgi:hypothetical protein